MFQAKFGKRENQSDNAGSKKQTNFYDQMLFQVWQFKKKL